MNPESSVETENKASWRKRAFYIGLLVVGLTLVATAGTEYDPFSAPIEGVDMSEEI